MASIAVRVPTPTDVVRGVFLPVEWTLEAAGLVATLPARVVALLDGAEEIISRIDLVVAAAVDVVAHVEETVRSADDVVARVNGVVDGAERLVGRAMPLVEFGESTVAEIAPVVEAVLVEQGIEIEQARIVTARVGELAAFADRVIGQLQPAIERVVDSIDPDEVEALVELIDHLPTLTRALEKDVLPVLADMDNVAPEVHQILTVAQDCLEALAGIPGFSLLRRRGETKVDPAD